MQASSQDDLKKALGGLSADERQKLVAALESADKAPAAAPAGAAKAGVTAEVLAKQNSESSQAVLEAYAEDPLFQKLSERLCKEIMDRDKQDGEKLAVGVQKAVDKKVLPADVEVEPTTKVSVTGKAADSIADEIVAKLGEAPSKGCVMTLQGLSGTGKGTTVTKLQEKLPNSQTWSNGNIFRSITLLCVTHMEKEGCSIEDALKPEKLQEFCGMLEFDKFGKESFDVKIEGLGLKYFVEEVKNTELKESKIAKNIPTVAGETQGEVVMFVNGALKKMAEAGINVLVEGREQTLNHIRTPHRFELVLDDTSLIGKRQAALQIGAKAWKEVNSADAAPDVVKAALDAALKALAEP